MLHTISVRGKFFISAIIFFLLSLILVLILPFAVIETLHDRNEHLILAMPFSNFQYLTLALASVFFCIIVLAFKRNTWTVLLTIIVAIMAVFISSHALSGYISIREDSLTVRELWNEKKMDWDDMSNIVFEYETGNQGDFIFTFNDGKTYVLPHSGNIGSQGKSVIYSMANAHGIPFKEQPKE